MDTGDGTPDGTLDSINSPVDGASPSAVAGRVAGAVVGGADTTVLVLGQVEALEELVSRLIGCGVLADADPVLPDAADPVRGSCLLRMTDEGGGRRRRRGSDPRTTPPGLLWALRVWLRRSGSGSARRPGGHRAVCQPAAAS